MLEVLEKPRILVVEDDLENQKFLRIFLKRKFVVDLCDSAEEFYQLMDENKYDIILMDISLRGGKDGLQITTELREKEATKNIPIIGLSAHAFQRDKDNAYKAGVDAFLTKPVESNYLLETLVKALEQKSGKTLN